MLTIYHAKYYSYLIRRQISHGYGALMNVIQSAAIDLNPHQIEAALFALKSPYQKACLFADETGLGKTIEAGLVLAHKWNQDRKHALIIAPLNLLGQWQEELNDKFDIPSVILDYKNFAQMQKDHGVNPFDREDCVIIVNYNFAKDKADFIKAVEFDIVIIDEAHRLRSVYKEDNVIARSIRDAVEGRYKLLLTATPFQNSLMELYGLMSFIDPELFPDADTFRSMYVFPSAERDKNFSDIIPILQNVCVRTLRKQVLQYIPYTERITVTHEFTPTPKEAELHEKIIRYVQRNNLSLFYKSQMHLIMLMLLKLLGSSSFALSATLYKLIERLKSTLEAGEVADITDILTDDEYGEIDVTSEAKRDRLTKGEIASINREIEYLADCYDIAVSIDKNAKADALLLALDEGFAKMEKLGAPRKAIIFTEYRRTQEYLYQRIKESTAYTAVTFNGENNDERSQRISSQYLYVNGGGRPNSIVTRRAIIDHFKSTADILIATEAAAEGLNLQFAALTINYDMPYNPQRIEQRIGRSHRYGQKHDVVVMNFINKNNLAEQRIFEILSRKFQLFEGFFGASDEVLGEVDGKNFEKRIAEIYRECRTEEEIQAAFDRLQAEYDGIIKEKKTEAKENILSHFSQSIINKFAISSQVDDALAFLDGLLWSLAKFKLRQATFFDDKEPKSFRINKSPYKGHKLGSNSFYLDKNVTKSERFNPNNPLATRILDEYQYNELYQANIVFEDDGRLAELKGQRGILGLWDFWVHNTLERDTHLVFAAQTQLGEPLTDKQCEMLFMLTAKTCLLGYDEYRKEEGRKPITYVEADQQTALQEIVDTKKRAILDETINRGLKLFDEEVVRLEACKDNEIQRLHLQLVSIKKQIGQLEQDVSKTLDPKRKVGMMKSVKDFKKEYERRVESLPDDILECEKGKEEKVNFIDEYYMSYYTGGKNLFFIRWEVV